MQPTVSLKVYVETPRGGRPIVATFLRETVDSVEYARNLADAYRRANPDLNIIGEYVHREAV